MSFALLISVLATFVITIGFGLIVYRSNKLGNYSFLNMFPFEMKSNDNEILNIVFRILVTIVTCLSVSYILLSLYFNIYAILLTKFLAGVMIVTSILLISLFIINFRSLKNHFMMNSLFGTLVFSSYLLFGYLTIRLEFEYYQLYQTIIAFVMAGILLILMFVPLFTSWFKNKKVIDESGKENIVRKKINTLCVLEWFEIFSFFVLLIIFYC